MRSWTAVPPRRLPVHAVVLALAATAAACERPPECAGEYCGTLVFAAAREPDILLPPVTEMTLSRDIYDQIFLKLADVGPALNTYGDDGFEPLLARSWEWEDSLTLAFRLDPRARWHDGRPVTAGDVAFTFAAYTDPAVNSPFRGVLQDIGSVIARDSLTAVFRFRRRHSEMFYDAVYHMRVLPAHLLHTVPYDRWATAEFGRQPIGNGPYRFVEWRSGAQLELAADSTFFLGRPHIRRLIWRFVPDLQAAVSQLVAGEADALEFLGPPENVRRVAAAPHLKTYPFASAIYTYLAFNLRANGDTAQPHPLFGDRDVRLALALATDRGRLLQSVLGDLAKVPSGPMPQMWWLWELNVPAPPYNAERAAALLARRGWRDSDGDGVRDKDGVTLAFRLMVPTTSGIRRQYAQLLQAQYRPLGVDVQIDEFEPAILVERGTSGRFDAALVSWQTDPSPASSVTQTWTSAGIGRSNYGRYADAEFDDLVRRAAVARPAQRRWVWTSALRRLNDDVPGIWLFAPDNIAAVHARVADVRVRPDAWWTYVRTWRIPPDRLIERDRVER
ncbi:MAG: ABC transporter substrate-binding protein [Gemmatimonadales bacterium]